MLQMLCLHLGWLWVTSWGSYLVLVEIGTRKILFSFRYLHLHIRILITVGLRISFLGVFCRMTMTSEGHVTLKECDSCIFCVCFIWCSNFDNLLFKTRRNFVIEEIKERRQLVLKCERGEETRKTSTLLKKFLLDTGCYI